jgi:hypothetical protein
MTRRNLLPIEKRLAAMPTGSGEGCGQSRARQLIADKNVSAAMNFETIHDHSEDALKNDHSNCGAQARQVFNQGLSAHLRLGA